MSAKTALRFSAILSILAAVPYAYGTFVVWEWGRAIDPTILWILIFVLAPLVPGVLAFFGRAPFLLPAAWGWVLGNVLPKMLMRNPDMHANVIPQTITGGHAFVIGPDYFGMTLAAVAVLGLALYGYSYYREHRPNRPAP